MSMNEASENEAKRAAAIASYTKEHATEILDAVRDSVVPHNHATGIWCDGCPDADEQRARWIAAHSPRAGEFCGKPTGTYDVTCGRPLGHAGGCVGPFYLSTACRGCGAPDAAPAPAMTGPEHCGKCPPWRCGDCGEPTSIAAPCDCWISVRGMPLADLKALFADDCDGLGLSLLPAPAPDDAEGKG